MHITFINLVQVIYSLNKDNQYFQITYHESYTVINHNFIIYTIHNFGQGKKNKNTHGLVV